MKSTDIEINQEEILLLRKAVQLKFEAVSKLNKQKYRPLAVTWYRDSYDGLKESMADELKKLPKIPDSIVASPGVSFLLNLFKTKLEKETFRIYYLNACYLYAFGKIRAEYRADLEGKSTADSKSETPCSTHGLSDSIYKIKPATYDDIRKIFSIASTVYTGIDVIPYKTMLAWYEKNPCSFYVIVNEDGDVVGNIDILPLKEGTLRQFLDGDMIERQILDDSIWGIDEKENIDYLYVESVVNLAGKVALLELIRNISEIFMNFDCDVKSIKKVYCISASPQGQRLIERFGFKEYKNSSSRRDKHSVFETDMITVLQNATSFFSDNNQHTDDYQRLKKLLDSYSSSHQKVVSEPAG
ncbi:hypothetical protein GCM10028803_48990 [Larkinella knui]|uniref:Uncharacterized protein n=1 Tax=Larkinella knui TaxID=2025310 RepID=A0A3P1CQD4_9BACT|nr:hypothetical protein [Larkinella knui]RRB15469.1 hypothetical protein EHT87_13165 [Larkinella knui]